MCPNHMIQSAMEGEGLASLPVHDGAVNFITRTVFTLVLGVRAF